MFVDLHSFMTFIHVLLFAYWLGADLGVFLCAKRLTRDDLSLEERLRTREIAMLIDMAPRSALVLMIPVGFTMAVPYGSPITGPLLIALWLACLAWLGLVWSVHHHGKTDLGLLLGRVDLYIRYVLLFVFLGWGLFLLTGDGPISDTWLAAKILLFGGIILNGIWLRRIAAGWAPAFDLVRAGGEERIKGEQMIKDRRALAGKAALTIWGLVAVMAFLGVVKPF